MLVCRSAAAGIPRQARDSQQQEQQQELAAALVAAEATNDRLRAIIAALRQEMEELQAASKWPGAVAVLTVMCYSVVLLSMQRMQSCQLTAEMEELQEASEWVGAGAVPG
jgi:hypothetical protein